MLCEISRCYEELDKFWTEEVCRAVTALESCRVDPRDVERWEESNASLQQTIESWKVWFFSISPGREQTKSFRLINNAAVSGTYSMITVQVPLFVHSTSSLRSVIYLTQGANLGAIASSLFPALSSNGGCGESMKVSPYNTRT